MFFGHFLIEQLVQIDKSSNLKNVWVRIKIWTVRSSDQNNCEPVIFQIEKQSFQSKIQQTDHLFIVVHHTSKIKKNWQKANKTKQRKTKVETKENNEQKNTQSMCCLQK